MTETELKIQLDAEAEARLRRHAALASLREGPARTHNLTTVYLDTEGHDLAAHGIALRLRREGRRWTQTVKRANRQQSRGLFATAELDHPAPGGRLNLAHDDPAGVYGEIRAILGDRLPAPVFETRVRRTAARLRAEAGLVELAIDRGEVIAGALAAPIREAELELVEGTVPAIFEVARALFDRGPLRFSAEPKSARGLRLARSGEADVPLEPRKAGTPGFDAAAGAETVVRDILRDCLAQIADNMVVVVESDAIEGPHQLRVGLRRLRSAIGIFRPTLGDGALAGLSAAARDLGRVVGALRDLDVLAEEVVAPAAALGLDEPARAALASAIEERRAIVRDRVRAELAGAAATRFVLDLAEAIEARGWLAPADYGQTARLAAPIGEVAPAILAKRHRKAMRMGRDIETLAPEALHELRKELKKLRYAADMLAPIFPAKRTKAYLATLKGLQDTFGSLNDAAMAQAMLGPPEPLGGEAPAAQRATGWVLGSLAVRVGDDRPRLFKAWRKLARAEPFWT